MNHVVSSVIFKAKCLQLLDQVRDTGREVVVTKKGIPVARLVPITARKRYGRVAAARIGGDVFTAVSAD
jgi:prevent-host-death family protein